MNSARGPASDDRRLTDPPASTAGTTWIVRHILQYAGIVGLAVGLLAALGICALMSIDYFAWRDVPVERALVTGQDVSPTQRVACGKALWPDTKARITSFLVAQPRTGFPATFSVTGCGLGVRAGDTVVLQRLPDTTEDDLMLGGPLAATDFLALGSSFGGIGFAAGAGWVLLVATVRPRWQRWVAAGRAPAA